MDTAETCTILHVEVLVLVLLLRMVLLLLDEDSMVVSVGLDHLLTSRV